MGLVYTSNLAEGTVNTLINERQKGSKKCYGVVKGLIMYFKLELLSVVNLGIAIGEKLNQKFIKLLPNLPIYL